MSVHITPTALQVRLYKDGVDTNKWVHEMTEHYNGVASIQLLDNGTARISALCGSLTKKDLKEICKILKQKYGIIRREFRQDDIERSIVIGDDGENVSSKIILGKNND